MNNFQSNRQRDNRGFREMHQAVCSQCGKDCQVPFRPTGDKPVYCSDCYEKLGNNSNSWSYGDDRPQRPSFGDRNSGGNRSFSNNRDFGGGRNFSNNRGSERSENRSFSKPTDNRQMEMVAKKLDRIIELLEGQRPVAKMVEKAVEQKIDKTMDKKPAKKATKKKVKAK